MTTKVKFTDDKEMIRVINKTRSIATKGVYQHFKGGMYMVEGLAKHSEDGTDLVIYRSLKTNEVWARPLSMFMDIKQTEEGYTFRFTRIVF
jgi:hypothetical protein